MRRQHPVPDVTVMATNDGWRVEGIDLNFRPCYKVSWRGTHRGYCRTTIEVRRLMGPAFERLEVVEESPGQTG